MAVPGSFYQGIILVILCGVLRSYAQERCSQAKRAYSGLGYTTSDIPSRMTSGTSLQVCNNGQTCCTRDMEENLRRHSKDEHNKIMADKIGLLRNIFVSRTLKFDTFFTELLEKSKRDLHEMFIQTYGLLYRQNAHIFTNLFDDVRDYYKGGDINLMDALDNFFSILYQKMFELINSQYQFDQNYLTCVTEHMDDLKPFGDVPQKLSVQVNRAFIAARTFVQGLAIGREVVFAVSKINPTKSCSDAITKMAYCPYCKNMPSIRPCNNYCMNVMKGCLAYHADLNHEWNQYIHELLKLAERLEGPFNIELVVDPIDVKISDAIMNFQENSQTVSEKVFSGCGHPRHGHRKRDTSNQEDPLSNTGLDYNFNSRRNQGPAVRPTTAAGTSLDRLVRDIKTKIEVVRDFWKDLPHSVCNTMAAPVDEDRSCWNGDNMARYRPEVMGDGVRNQNNNPEVEVEVRKPNVVLDQQLHQLRLVTQRLRLAYDGLDVDYIDTAEGGPLGSMGSGDDRGSGSDDERDRGSGYDDQMDDGSADMGSGGGMNWNPYQGYNQDGRGNNNNNNGWDIGGNGGWDSKNSNPIQVQTRRPPQGGNDANHYQQENNYYQGSPAPSVHAPHRLLLPSVLSLIITVLLSRL